MPRFEDSKEIVANEDVLPIDEQYRKSMPHDFEYEQFQALTGSLRHYCPDWDFMAIDQFSLEFYSCTCDFSGIIANPL